MPEMDGYQATRKIRLLQEHWIPIMLLTGRGNDDDLAKGIESGGDDYLIKPVSPIVLNAKMAAMERIAAMRHELISSQKELAQVNALLKHQAEMDGLTGLINRRTFDTKLRREIQQARVDQTPLSIAMLDVDYFKKYNDRYGHLQGDDCLKSVARCLDQSVKGNNRLVARYGGEEFIAIAPNTHKSEISELALEVANSVYNLGISHEDSEHDKRVTISIGVCSVIPDEKTTPDTLITLADQALYKAKLEGRNTVVTAQ